MAGDTFWLNAVVAFASLGGFMLLALASERQGEALLGRACVGSERLTYRSGGWLLLVVAFGLCIWGWGSSIGPVAWLGWLCMAGAVLAFTLPRWTEKKSAKAMPPSALMPPVRSKVWRAFALALLATGPIALAWSLADVPVKPTLRPDAVAGQAGPGTFTLAEAEQAAPETDARGRASKAFQIRFCEACDADIKAVYLKLGKPASLKDAGPAFRGARWDRSVTVPLSREARGDGELWVTVEGRNGEVSQAAVRLEAASPEAARWIAADSK